jgi:ADP-ribose pyrophosphatase
LKVNDKSMPIRLSRKTLCKSLWVNHFVDRVEFPDGRIAEEHHCLEHDHEAVAALITDTAGRILMIEAYRYVTSSIEWEIPAGLIDPGESIFQAGQREVLEETGYDTGALRMLYTYQPMNGLSNKVFNIVTGTALVGTGQFDRNEVRSVCWHSPEQIRQMIATNSIRDGYTLTALLLHFLSCQDEP